VQNGLPVGRRIEKKDGEIGRLFENERKKAVGGRQMADGEWRIGDSGKPIVECGI